MDFWESPASLSASARSKDTGQGTETSLSKANRAPWEQGMDEGCLPTWWLDLSILCGSFEVKSNLPKGTDALWLDERVLACI